jgi:hypothetical protein
LYCAPEIAYPKRGGVLAGLLDQLLSCRDTTINQRSLALMGFYIDATLKLRVFVVLRNMILGTASEMDVFTITEPKLIDAHGARTFAVKI